MTQAEQILDYLAVHSSITPAKMSGTIYNGRMFGSETSRACRKLRTEGKIVSERQGKFKVFYLKGKEEPVNIVKIAKEQQGFGELNSYNISKSL